MADESAIAEAPETDSVDASGGAPTGAALGLSAAAGTQPPVTPSNTTTTPTLAPQPPVVQKPGVFDNILQAIGGGPQKQVTKDPKTGQTVVSDAPFSRKRAIAHIFAGALEGMFAGLEHSQGPGGELKALAAGGETGIRFGQESAAAPQKAADAANARAAQLTRQQQEEQLRAHQIIESNLHAMVYGRQAFNLGEDAKDKLIASNKDQLDAWHSQEEESGAKIFVREHVPYSQYLAEYQQPGANHASTYAHTIDGKTPLLDSKTGEPQTDDEGNIKTEYTVAVVDPDAPAKVRAAVVDHAAKTGYPVPGYTPGSHDGDFDMSALSATNLMHHEAGVTNFESAVRTVNQTLGLTGDKALDAKKLIETSPQLGSALYPLAQHWDGRPESLAGALQKMQAPDKSGQVNPANAAAARAITTAIGGDKIDEFDEKLKNQKEATAAGMKKGAEAAAAEPFEEAKEKRVNAAKTADEDRRAHAKDDQLVIAGTPGSDETQVMRKGDLPQGWMQYPLKDPEQLTATIRRTNDVQTKINSLADFVQKGGMAHIQPGLVGDAIAEVNNEFKVGAFGTELPMARMNSILKNENYKNLTQPSIDFIRAYGFAREAMTQLPALQSYGKSNRMNETQLKAALQLLPDERMAGNSKAAMDQMNALQDVFDPLRKLPSGLPGATLIPSFREANRGQAQPAAPAAAPAANANPFADFGGRVLSGRKKPAATAGTPTQ